MDAFAEMTDQMHNEDSREKLRITDSTVTESVSEEALSVWKRRLEVQSGVSLSMWIEQQKKPRTVDKGMEVFQSLQTKRVFRDVDYDAKQKCIHYYLIERVGLAVTLSSRNREIIGSNLEPGHHVS
jgi:hypothetical protein